MSRWLFACEILIKNVNLVFRREIILHYSKIIVNFAEHSEECLDIQIFLRSVLLIL